ncbi:hypothetical protein AGABI1DRAFT_79964 [Agaricus bisporus var. burnettii JB137-S8]|uniref:Fe2OG dioxygenase domain-containing protein n=1 Tax=Agaricus bisporus var. burnettii (strain JB137-S8 / ATCC MYA-4627 / FGSC 10392) TaxID=597362 RepID=K5WXQ9_AGABU|nr:uncharacterized protein AGABI1DRAFT_79964 [Agaricus bisporus var. burnettii JB137-S8]EKM75382.1 hypothetical protein AGABI1DRAFT_79964 [Agaricus bisporus var. burnettii JB137-S8]
MTANLLHGSHRVGDRDVIYIPNFLSEEEEKYIIRKASIHDSPQQKWKQLANRRLQIWGGEITAKGLLPQSLPPYALNYPNLLDRLKETGAFLESPHGSPNHIILNEYRAGQGIMPHEDGPKYFPVVATISLGSHTVFNYYRYKPNHPEPGDSEGKIVDKIPIMSLLLEPRSVVISSGEMYTCYLHGIDPVEEDRLLPSNASQPSEDDPEDSESTITWTTIDNWSLLGDEHTKHLVTSGSILKRGTRYSLTCRDVERVCSAKSFRFPR